MDRIDDHAVQVQPPLRAQWAVDSCGTAGTSAPPLDPEAVASLAQALDVLQEVPAYSLEVAEVRALFGAIDVAVSEIQVITCQDPLQKSSMRPRHAPSRLGRLPGRTCAPS